MQELITTGGYNSKIIIQTSKLVEVNKQGKLKSGYMVGTENKIKIYINTITCHLC